MYAPYTQSPGQSDGAIFPTNGMSILSSTIHLSGVSILSYCFAQRTASESLWTVKGWLDISLARLCIILIMAVSWLFVFETGVLIGGAGLSLNSLTCSLGIYSCISLYALTKILIYFFLVERVYIVWAPGEHRRWDSRVYRICFITMLGYAAVLGLLISGRISYRRDDGACAIGLKNYASIPLLTYDLYINVFLTSLFVFPLWRDKVMSPALRYVAIRTLVAAFAALSTSCVNVLILTLRGGTELGWVCLASCGTDVTVNALILFVVTSPHTYNDAPFTLPQLDHTSRSKSVPVDVELRREEFSFDSTPPDVEQADTIGSVLTRPAPSYIPSTDPRRAYSDFSPFCADTTTVRVRGTLGEAKTGDFARWKVNDKREAKEGRAAIGVGVHTTTTTTTHDAGEEAVSEPPQTVRKNSVDERGVGRKPGREGRLIWTT